MVAGESTRDRRACPGGAVSGRLPARLLQRAGGDHRARPGGAVIDRLQSISFSIIRGEFFSPRECDGVVHSLLDAIYARAPCTVIQRVVHIHPTVTELIPTMLRELKPLE